MRPRLDSSKQCCLTDARYAIIMESAGVTRPALTEPPQLNMSSTPLADGLKAVIDQLRACDARQAAATTEFINSAHQHLAEMAATTAEMEAEIGSLNVGEAVEILRSRGWMLTPPRA